MNRSIDSSNLVTDVEGRIFLGALDNVYQVTAGVSSVNGNQSVCWTIGCRNEIVSYPT